MNSADAGFIAAVVGLGFLLSFMQTARRRAMTRISSFILMLGLPLAAALLWRMALTIGWWTAGLFVVLSLAVGALGAVTARNAGGFGVLYSMQAPLGIGATVCAALAWSLR